MWLSAGIVFLLALIPATSQHGFGQAISLELAQQNPTAWILMGFLCAFLAVFAKRLTINRHVVRASLIWFLALGILILAFTPPASLVHQGVLTLISILAVIWFAVMGADYDLREMSYGALGALAVLPIMAVFGMGIAEGTLILYCMVCSNILYYYHLDPEGRTRWP